MKPTHHTSVEYCNRLLRGERTAALIYQLAIRKYPGYGAGGDLLQIRKDHERSAAELEKHIIELGGRPDTGIGTVGTLAAALQCVLNQFGPMAAVNNLRGGEIFGAQEYRIVLRKHGLPRGTETLLADTLLPRLEEHTERLKLLETNLCRYARSRFA